MRFKMRAVPVGLFALVAGAALPAAPVPKQSQDAEPADLKGLHALVGKAVESGKWPSAEDEKKIKATLQKLLDRITKAGDLKERKLPVAFDKMKKVDVAAEIEKGHAEKLFLIAGDFRGGDVSNSVILASGKVDCVIIQNSIVVGKKILFTGVTHGSLLIAGDFLKGATADSTRGGFGPVLIAGQWICLTAATGAICHVLRPGPDPSPIDARNRPMFNAIQMTAAEKTLFLNQPTDISRNRNEGNTILPPKTPIAR